MAIYVNTDKTALIDFSGNRIKLHNAQLDNTYRFHAAIEEALQDD